MASSSSDAEEPLPAVEVVGNASMDKPVIPPELQDLILGHSELKSLLNCRSVCRSWNELTCSKHLRNTRHRVLFQQRKNTQEFVELMGNSIEGQAFPFTMFVFVYDEIENWKSGVELFTEKYGSEAKRYVFYFRGTHEGMNFEAINDWIQRVLIKSPNIESLSFEGWEFRSDCRGFRPTMSLRKLKEINGLDITNHEEGLLDGFIAVAPNLQKIRISLKAWDFPPDPITMRAKIEKILHVPIVVLDELQISPSLESIELFRIFTELPLKIASLSMEIEIKASPHLQVFLRLAGYFLSKLSPTLKTLRLRLVVDCPTDTPFQIPYLEKLEKLFISTGYGCYAARAFCPLDSNHFPNLTTVEVTAFRPEEVFKQQDQFLSLKTLCLENLYLQPSTFFSAQVFPNLQKLELTYPNAEELSLVLLHMQQVKHLVLRILEILQTLSALNGGESLPAEDDTSWMSASSVQGDPDINPHFPSLANFTNLASLTLISLDSSGKTLLTGITYLSSIKKIRRLRRLALSAFIMDLEDDLMQQFSSRLRECHVEVSIKAENNLTF